MIAEISSGVCSLLTLLGVELFRFRDVGRSTLLG
jgi:hypothetical protein